MSRKSTGHAVVKSARSPQQSNGYDCGLYVLGESLQQCADLKFPALPPYCFSGMQKCAQEVLNTAVIRTSGNVGLLYA